MNVDSGFFSRASDLATGGRGFSGSALVQTQAGLDVDWIVVIGRENKAAFDDPKLTYTQLNPTGSRRIQSDGSRDDITIVFHSAGMIDHTVRSGIYIKRCEIHLHATLCFIDSVRGGRLRKFVQGGGNAEYGAAPVPQRGDSRCVPNSAYGASKLSATHTAMDQALSEGFTAAVVLTYVVFEKGMLSKSPLDQVLDSARRRVRFATATGMNTWDFVPVSKVVADLLHAAADPAIYARILNMCIGEERTVRSVSDQIARHVPGFTSDFGRVPYRVAELVVSVGIPYVPISKMSELPELNSFLKEELCR
jgi:nucleoside-diphosphate-sugar epimerase